MSAPFRLARGVRVADLSGIREGYALATAAQGHAVITVNVSAERLRDVVAELAALVVAPGFLVLQVGSNRAIEGELRVSESDPLHEDVHYLDGLSHEGFRGIFARYADLWAHDGLIQFGFGSHAGVDEVFVGPYKIVHVYAAEPDKYVRTLATLGFRESTPLRTVWNNFSSETPGQRSALSDVEPTIWQAIEQLEHEGLYFAERRES